MPEADWTASTLYTHVFSVMEEQAKRFDQRFRDLEKMMHAGIDAGAAAVEKAEESSEKAIEKAEHATEKRFESVNEFRQALSDQTATFIPRVEYLNAIARMGDRITELSSLAADSVPRSEAEASLSRLNEQLKEITGRMSVYMSRSEIEATVSRSSERVEEMSKRIQGLADRLNVSQGRGQGVNALWLWFVGGLGAIATCVSVYASLARR